MTVSIQPPNNNEVVIRQDPPARVVETQTPVEPRILRTSTGIPGRDGRDGADGADGRDASLTNAAYEHVQVAVSDEWYIEHNLGYRPQVSAFDSGGTAVEGDVETINANALRLHFSSAFAGGAYLS